MDSSFSSTNSWYPKMNRPREYSSASGPELRSSPTSSPDSAYLTSSGSRNAKHAELLVSERLASQRRGRPRARLAQGYQDVNEAKRDLDSSAYTPVAPHSSRAKKSVPVYTCDICKRGKDLGRAEYLRLHQLSLQKPGRDPKNALDLYCPDMTSVFAKRHNKEIADGSFDIEYALIERWNALDKEGVGEMLRKWKQVETVAEVEKKGGARGRQTLEAGSRDTDDDVERAEEGDDVDLLSDTRMNGPGVSSDSDSTYPTRSDEPGNPLDKFAETFKKMEGKAWKSSAKFSGISPTISKDNTSGECARQAKLFAEFGQRKFCAFASSFAQHYEGGNGNGYVQDHSASSSMGGSSGQGRVSSMDMGIDAIINAPGNGRD